MILLLCAAAALAYVAVVACLLVGWGGIFSQMQRAGLALSACGMVGAGFPRMNGDPPGLFDLMFLAGLMTFLARTYGPEIFKRLDVMHGLFERGVHLERPRHDA